MLEDFTRIPVSIPNETRVKDVNYSIRHCRSIGPLMDITNHVWQYGRVLSDLRFSHGQGQADGGVPRTPSDPGPPVPST